LRIEVKEEKGEKRPLTPDEIRKAKDMVSELHPLTIMPIRLIFPTLIRIQLSLRIIFCCFKTQGRKMRDLVRESYKRQYERVLNKNSFFEMVLFSKSYVAPAIPVGKSSRITVN
jgi:hypothetical protein